MRRRLSLAVILLSALVVLAPLAYSSPPDPAWIAGIYDDGDFDDVILAVTSIHKSLECIPFVVGGLFLIFIEFVQFDDQARPFPFTLPAFPARAPPIA